MNILKLLFFSLALFSAHGKAQEITYSCLLKIHCSQLHQDQSLSFEYVAGGNHKEAKTVDLGIVRGRVFGPHYLSLYLFDTRKPNTTWAKTHSRSLVNDLEISLVIPEDSEHSMVANLVCSQKQ